MEEAWEPTVVITSAASLHSALTAIGQNASGEKFADAVLYSVGNSDGHKAEAFRLMSELYLNLSADIEAAFTDKLLASLQRTAKPFDALLLFRTYDETLHQLSNQAALFLHPSTVDSLLILDAALQGKCERPIIHQSEQINLSLSALRDDLAELGLPQNIHQLMETRVAQLERAVREFAFYGVDGLTRSIEELMGSVEVHVKNKVKKPSSYKKLRKSLTETVLTITGAVAVTNTAIKEVKMLDGHVADIVALIPDFTNSDVDLENNSDD